MRLFQNKNCSMQEDDEVRSRNACEICSWAYIYNSEIGSWNFDQKHLFYPWNNTLDWNKKHFCNQSSFFGVIRKQKNHFLCYRVCCINVYKLLWRGRVIIIEHETKHKFLLFYLCIYFNKIEQTNVCGCIANIDVGGEWKGKKVFLVI